MWLKCWCLCDTWIRELLWTFAFLTYSSVNFVCKRRRNVKLLCLKYLTWHFANFLLFISAMRRFLFLKRIAKNRLGLLAFNPLMPTASNMIHFCFTIFSCTPKKAVFADLTESLTLLWQDKVNIPTKVGIFTLSCHKTIRLLVTPRKKLFFWETILGKKLFRCYGFTGHIRPTVP